MSTLTTGIILDAGPQDKGWYSCSLGCKLGMGLGIGVPVLLCVVCIAAACIIGHRQKRKERKELAKMGVV